MKTTSRVAPRMTTLATENVHAPPLRAGFVRLGADELVLFERPASPLAFDPSGGPLRRRFDALHAIHACYAPEPTTRAWLEGVLAALRPLAPSARWFAWNEGAGDPGSDPRAAEAPLPSGTAAGEIVDAIGRECYRDLLRPSPAVQLLSHRLRTLPAELERRVSTILRGHGVEDAVLLFGGDVHGRAIVLGMLASHDYRPPSRTVGFLRHVAGHLNTARLLRERFPRGGPCRTDARSIAPRAVAELVARDAFTWVDADQGAHRWCAFIDGRYALVDHWAARDRRRLLVRRCHAAGDPAALRSGETAALTRLAGDPSPDRAAEQLAMRPTAVALHLSSARARLRCGSRRELASLVWTPSAAPIRDIAPGR
jgi:hypothetical protein